jgi:phage shock protein A
MASGALEDHVSGGQDYIQQELDRLGANNEIESELARMRGELPSANQQQRQIESNGGAAAGGSAAEGNGAGQQPGAGDGR